MPPAPQAGGTLLSGSGDETKERYLPSVDRLEFEMREGKRALDGGQLDDALRHFTTALRLKPEYDAAWLGRGHALRKMGDFEGALESFAQALRAKRDSEDGWLGLASILHILGRGKEEIEAYDELLRLRPRLVEAWINKGASLHERGDFRGAVACYDRVLELRPEHAAAWNNKGAALLRLGDVEAAARCVEEALHFNPDFHDAILNRLFLLEETRRHGETVIWAERALGLRETPVLWYLKGLAHLGLLESTLAMKAFERALELDPNLREARTALRKAKGLREKVDVYRGVYECFGTHLEGDPGCAECEILARCREVSP